MSPDGSLSLFFPLSDELSCGLSTSAEETLVVLEVSASRGYSFSSSRGVLERYLSLLPPLFLPVPVCGSVLLVNPLPFFNFIFPFVCPPLFNPYPDTQSEEDWV